MSADTDLTILRDATASLERSVNVIRRKQKETNVPLDEMETLKSGVIQAFEYTYELCWKLIQKYLAYNISKDAVLGLSRKELFRLAAEKRLIDNLEEWMEFHKARNSTSHEYSGKIAETVLQKAMSFFPFAKHLLEALGKPE
ncbi:nucleotidyltransferase [Planctomycetales bacterium]|nr:nucleotidyltransferase [Planctomycetales bacterium]